MRITEQPVDLEFLTNIRNCAGDAANLVGLDLAANSPLELITAVDTVVYDWQKGRPASIDEDDAPLVLGSLWGAQLVRQFGWEWASVVFHDHEDAQAVGVFSPDRSLAIYPFHFIHGCLENDAPVTILLAFNILLDGTRIPPLPPRGYENVMDNVHHIVPRE